MPECTSESLKKRHLLRLERTTSSMSTTSMCLKPERTRSFTTSFPSAPAPATSTLHEAIPSMSTHSMRL